MSAESLSFTARLLAWQTGHYGELCYVLIDGEAAETISSHELIRRLETGRRRGFGSVKLEVAVGGSRWSTSAFPLSGGGWFLPIKKAVRNAEGLSVGDMVTVTLDLK